MAFRIKRKPFKIGSSWAITLPAGWCRYYGERISTLTMIGHTLLILAPKGLEDYAMRIAEEEENAKLQSD